MKTEELTALGLTEEQATKVLALNGLSVEKHKKRAETLEQEKTDLEGRLKTAEDTLKSFEGIDPQKIQQELDGYKKKADDAEKNFKSQMIARDQRDWLKEQFDKYGVASPYARRQLEGLLQRRSQNHKLRMVSELDTAFFQCAAENAVEVEIASGTAIEDELEQIIQECENTKNDFVDGVPRELMYLVLNTQYYGKVRNNLDTKTRSNVDTGEESFKVWHGVECDSCVHLPSGVRYILMVAGAVAQPVMANEYSAEKIPLSEAYGVELFYHYGTEAVTPDLIFTGVDAA